MTHRWLAGFAVLLAACSGAPASTTPATSPRETVSAFMAAAADSNLAKMGTLWGTAKGSAAETRQPADWERRVEIMQVYLRNSEHRVLSEAHGDAPDQRVLLVQFQRDQCTVTVPVTVVQTSGGRWVVNSIDLNSAGTPGRPCPDQTQP